MGGIGKTELAIELVLKLWRQSQFSSIYSGTAKNSMMTPLGTQNIDPMFQDYATFMADLAGWLGFEHPAAPSEEEAFALESRCLQELKTKPKTLLFVDNLETVSKQLEQQGNLFLGLEAGRKFQEMFAEPLGHLRAAERVNIDLPRLALQNWLPEVAFQRSSLLEDALRNVTALQELHSTAALSTIHIPSVEYIEGARAPLFSSSLMTFRRALRTLIQLRNGLRYGQN